MAVDNPLVFMALAPTLCSLLGVSKSQLSLGMRNPRLAANVTTMSPTEAPTSDGNSGPNNTAMAR